MLFLISLAALCGLTQTEQLICMPKSFINESNPDEKVLRPSLKNGTRLSFSFSLKTDNNNSGHYVDFESYTRQVVLRLQFNHKCDNCNKSQLTLSSIRRKNTGGEGYDTPETVGKTEVKEFSHGTIPVQIILNTTVTDKGFYFTIEAQKDGDEYYDPVKHFRVHEYNYIPYQTTSIIYLKPLPNLVARICYPDDECKRVCLSCPQGTRLQPLVDSDEGSNFNNTHFNNTHKCTECFPGTHSASVNSEQCSVCHPGYFAEMFSMSSCEQCSKGTSSNITGRSTECDQCVLGSYSSEPGAKQCVTCPAGSITDKATGAKTCTPCEAGTFSPGETTVCRNCPDNSVSPNTGTVECEQCIYGALTATHCTCVAGTQRVSETTCEVCKEGTYTPRDNMIECLECAGKVTETHKCECPGHMKLVDDVCVRNSCTPGQKKNADGTCSTCSHGSYSVEADSEKCLLCDPGSYQDTEGDVQCKPCPQGTSQHLRGSGSCAPCQLSTYQNKIGQRTCTHCRGTVNSVEHSCQEDLFECGANTIEYTNIGSVTWPRADNNKVVKVKCEHGGIALRSCVEDSWLQPILLDCNSQVTEKLNKVLDNNDNQDVEAIKEIVSEEISQFGPKDIKKVAIAIETISPKNKQVATSKLETAVQITSYDTTLQHVFEVATSKLETAVQITSYDTTLQHVFEVVTIVTSNYSN
ncbi:uncharacterized protein LOC134811103 isoform X2 [Bolinopsis microptera]|uniref:uncharacterized protein LOC134811103 isoform X2 n=1 Tax=Bolinopsis microptera TaxID=2820187 RepID=UPI003078DD1F